MIIFPLFSIGAIIWVLAIVQSDSKRANRLSQIQKFKGLGIEFEFSFLSVLIICSLFFSAVSVYSIIMGSKNREDDLKAQLKKVELDLITAKNNKGANAYLYLDIPDSVIECPDIWSGFAVVQGEQINDINLDWAPGHEKLQIRLEDMAKGSKITQIDLEKRINEKEIEDWVMKAPSIVILEPSVVNMKRK